MNKNKEHDKKEHCSDHQLLDNDGFEGRVIDLFPPTPTMES